MDTDLQRLQHGIGNSLTGLDASQTQLRPAARPDAWSIQQIVEHLLLTYASTETAITVRLEKRTPTRTKPTAWQRLAQPSVCRFGYFPHGRKAPEIVVPPATSHPLSGGELTHAAAQQLARLDTLFTEAHQVFGTGRCITHHVLGPLTIPHWRRFHLIHGNHHLKQIAAIRKTHHL